MTPLHLAAESGQPGAYHLIMENVVNKNPLNIISDEMSRTYREKNYMNFVLPLPSIWLPKMEISLFAN